MMDADFPEYDNFAVGEEVIFTPKNTRGSVKATVRKVTTARVTVECNGYIEVLHRSKYGRAFQCRRVTEADRAQEKYETDLVAWKDAKPACKVMDVHVGGWMRSARVRLEATLATAGDIDAIDAELLAIREWLRKRPEEPK